MKKIALLLLIAGCFTACGDKKIQKNQAVTQLDTNAIKAEKAMEQEIPVLLGVKKRGDLEAAPYNTWFSANYEAYETDRDAIRQLKPLLKDVSVTIFMGTWCGDSKEQTPHLYKILDAAGYNEKKLTLITVSRDKTTPEKHEAGHNIIKVPTIIFYKNGSELNRIVEYPIESLEKDMLAILSGMPYKHAYAD